MEARQLVLRCFTDRLPTSVPWVCSRVSAAGRTDIFIVDPAWNAEFPQANTLIHSIVAATLVRGVHAASKFKRFEVTVLLGDDVMNSQLHYRARGRAADVAVLYFAQIPASFSSRRSDCKCLGCIALAREALLHEAKNCQLSLSHHLASTVIDAVLALLGHADGEARAQVAHAIRRDLEFGNAGFGGSPVRSTAGEEKRLHP